MSDVGTIHTAAVEDFVDRVRQRGIDSVESIYCSEASREEKPEAGIPIRICSSSSRTI